MPARKPPQETIRWTGERGGPNLPTTVVAIHESVGITEAWDLALFCERRGVSYHDLVDLGQLIHTVPFEFIAWHLRKANPRAVGLCLTTPVQAYNRAQWLGPQFVKVEYAAWWAARTCHIRGVPIRLLTPQQIRAAVRGDKSAAGICTHEDYTIATGDGTHVDPRNFPKDAFLQMALGAAGQPDLPIPPSEEKEMEYLPIQLPPGEGWYNAPLPVGKSSQVIKRVWISAIVNGPEPGSFQFWFQDDDSGISSSTLNVGFRDGRSDRKWVPVPDGTTQFRLLHKAKQGGAIAFELD